MLFTRPAITILVAIFTGLTAHAATFNVTVGPMVGPNKKNVFDPTAVKANVGDIVSFRFASNGHTVTQGPVPDDCTFLAGGFDEDHDAGYVFDYKVTSTNPISVHCTPHCGGGMKMTINAKPNAVPTIFQAYISNPIHAAVNCLNFF